MIIFGGKGVVPVGQKKEQWESEFIYRFRWRSKFSINNKLANVIKQTTSNARVIQ